MQEPDLQPATHLDDGLPATWEPVEEEDDTMDAALERRPAVLPA